MEEFTDARGRKYRDLDGIELIAMKSGDDKKVHGRIFELSEEEAKDHFLIGYAEGQDFNHCVFVAWNNAKDFFDRVYGYRIGAPENPQMKVRVFFYERE